MRRKPHVHKWSPIRRGYPQRICKCGLLRVNGIKSGENTITVGVPGTGDVVRWSATQAAVAAGDVGMDVATGRLQQFLGGVSRPIGSLSDDIRLFYSDQMDNPVNADWAVNALAPAAADSVNAGLSVRRFDDTAEEGVGFILSIPIGTTDLVLTLKSRAETAPAAAEGVVPRLYVREIPDNAAVGAWSAGLDLTAISIPTNVNFQYDSQTISFLSLGITAGRLYQFELTRNPAAVGDTLVGDWNLVELGASFS